MPERGDLCIRRRVLGRYPWLTHRKAAEKSNRNTAGSSARVASSTAASLISATSAKMERPGKNPRCSGHIHRAWLPPVAEAVGKDSVGCAYDAQGPCALCMVINRVSQHYGGE